MNHVIAKIRQRGKETEKFKKVISDVTIFQLPDCLEPYQPYSPKHILDEDSWFGIRDFSKENYFPDFLKKAFLSTEIDMLKKDELPKIDFLVSIQDQHQYYFQKLSPSFLLRQKKISLGDVVEYRENSREILIKEDADAIYLEKEDTLYFRRITSITGIFKGIDNLYREASQEETAEFLESEFVSLENEFSAAKVKQANRKRIALAMDTIKKYDDSKKTIIFNSMKKYCPAMVTKEGKFRVASETDLKMLLYGIDQRFYTTPDGEEKRIANSIIRIE